MMKSMLLEVECCSGCGTGGKACAGCMPEGGFQHMGVMWEVVNGGSR